MARPFIYKADPNNVLWIHTFPEYISTTGGKIITASASTMFDPATTSASLYELYFNIVNQDTGNAVTVTVALDPAGGTTIASPDIIYNAQSLAAKAETGWQGPFLLNGDTTVNASATATNDGSFFFRCGRVKDPLI